MGEPVLHGKTGVVGIGEQPAARVAALRLLGQSVAMYSDKVIHKQPEGQSRTELVSEIEALLKDLIPEDSASDEFDRLH